MTALKPHRGIRVLCLREGSESRTPLPDLLTPHPKLQYLGSFDIAPAPFERVRALQPDVVILQLPMSTFQVLRWVNYLRTGLNDCVVVLTGPLDAPYSRQRVAAYGADDFIAQHLLGRRLVRRIIALCRKRVPVTTGWLDGPRAA